MSGKTDNLKPFKPGDPRAREAGRKGGKAYAKAVAERKTFRELAESLRDMVESGRGKYAGLSHGQRVVAKLYQQAERGNVKAARTLFDLLGETKLQVTFPGGLPTLIDDVPRAADPEPQRAPDPHPNA